MPGRFKDYIAIPRVNGYQSLHTTLFGPNGVPVEVQIRTEDMDRIAESGIAAHWLYKSGDRLGSAPQARAREWLQQLVDMQEGGSSEEFLESVKIDLFPDKVYVFTPKGDILRLPRGATCVDFAFAVHTAIGNRCVAARVDRRPVPLRTPLKNGQTVQIITSRNASPNPAWVNFVVTAKARTAIRNYLKNLRRGEAADLGRRLLDNALREYSLSVRKIPRKTLAAALEQLGLENREALFEQIGLGERMATLVARRLVPGDAPDHTDGDAAPLTIAGTEGMVVSYGRCCHPLPGDTIFGYLSAGRGLVIHREDCGNLAEFRKQPDKWIPVEWEAELDRTFIVEIRAEVKNRLGVLAAVAANISATGTNIEHVSVVERDGDMSSLTFQLQVKDTSTCNACYAASTRCRTWSASSAPAPDTDPGHEETVMARRPIATDSAPGAIGTYSQAIEADGTVYLSGQIPLDPVSMELVTGDIREEIRRVFDNLSAVAAAAGASLDDAVKLTVYLVDLGDFGAVNEVMATFFSEPYPARAAIQVAALPKGARVEVDAILRP